jgi:integrase
MAKIAFTEAAIRRAAVADGQRQTFLWDNRLRGFGLRISGGNPAVKAWIAQRELPGGISRRVTLGYYPAMTLTQARQAAIVELSKMLQGIDPNATRRRQVQEQQLKEYETYTLRQALENHIGFMQSKHCADRSLETQRDAVERLLAPWLGRPLISISRKDCIERHRQLTSRHGPVAANRALRCFRACWRSAQRLFEQLPPHPVFVVYNKQQRKRSPIPWEQLPAWWAGVEALDNPVRRDLNLLILLTGLRSEDARTIRWEHIDFDKGTLHRPKPKGGVDRAFTIPLCAYLLGTLAKRKLNNVILFNDDRGWAFPTRDNADRVTHVRDARKTKYIEDDKGKLHKITAAPTPHRLRRLPR